MLLVPIVFQKARVPRNGLLEGVSSQSASSPQGTAPTGSGLHVHNTDSGLPISLRPQALVGLAAISRPENHSSYLLARVASWLSFDSFCQDAKMPNELELSCCIIPTGLLASPEGCLCHYLMYPIDPNRWQVSQLPLHPMESF